MGGTNVRTVFLDSLSRSQHSGIAVFLSGLDKNGAAALKHLKNQGGIVIAQKPSTAASPDMPFAAIETGQVDYVLEPEEIAATLNDIAEHFKHSSWAPRAG